MQQVNLKHDLNVAMVVKSAQTRNGNKDVPT